MDAVDSSYKSFVDLSHSFVSRSYVDPENVQQGGHPDVDATNQFSLSGMPSSDIGGVISASVDVNAASGLSDLDVASLLREISSGIS